MKVFARLIIYVYMLDYYVAVLRRDYLVEIEAEHFEVAGESTVGYEQRQGGPRSM